MNELLAVARAAAQDGASVLRQYLGRVRVDEWSQKGVADFVTHVDHAAEAVIVERIRQAFPSHDILAEEAAAERTAGSGVTNGGREWTWIVDPLDGTTNFVHGHPFWAVSIGVLDGERPLAGAVVAPCLGLRWAAWSGGPALRNDAPCRVSATARLAHALVATGFPPERDRAPHDNFGSFVAVKRAARGVRRCGSAAIDMCFVADGTYDGYWERKLNVWDLAAGAALVQSAGGRITALDGSEPHYAVGHIVASNGLIHDELLERLDRGATGG